MQVFDKKAISIIFSACLCFTSAQTLRAESIHDCKSFQLLQKIRGRCHWVSGNLFIYNGWPPNTRLSITGTKQVYGVGPNPEEGLMPSYLDKVLQKSKGFPIRGKFEICPFGDYFRVGDQTPDEPDLRDICIQSAKNLYYKYSYYFEHKQALTKWIALKIPKHFYFTGIPTE